MSETPRERLARALYELEPMWQSGEYVESVQVTPSAPLPWSICCSFAPDVAAKFYNNADALLAADYMHRDEAMEEAAEVCDERAKAARESAAKHNLVRPDVACDEYAAAQEAEIIAAALRQKGKP